MSEVEQVERFEFYVEFSDYEGAPYVHARIDAIGGYVTYEDYATLASQLSASEALLAEARAWKAVVIDELVTAHIYTAEHDTNPRKAVQDAITWNCQVALDPAVSSDASALVAAGRAGMLLDLADVVLSKEQRETL